MRNVACGTLAVWAVATASPVIAASQRLPPLSIEPNRCEGAFVGNTIGQANGVYDKPIDLRFCDYTNEKNNLKGKSLAAALMSDAKFDGADMTEVVMSKAYVVGASFKAFKGDKFEESAAGFREMRNVACGTLAVWAVATASPVIAASQRLPPLSIEPNRCEGAFVGNTIGQANGVYDKPIDLRFCDYTNEKNNLKGKSLAAALMSDAKFDGADMTEVVMSKAYVVGASFKGVDFSTAVLDRVNFGKANLQGAVFRNTVLSGSTFDEARLEDAVFEDTIIGYINLQKICRNTTMGAEGRAELGCR
ncbi:thylakoid lumenal 17.4 kDa protein, chloroplastic-like [Actinidia eriantha]|uniref:thylakoid lumenal 17.4 kDa protein, chloroplastic-like n=1 Tax=Actinidia eriantha TaxID=165200 RepID=UPI00258A723B|nr:thylakoid lumenal 17.4 kDa protein, chloroplastic-like [Actinidia eriantha]